MTLCYSQIHSYHNIYFVIWYFGFEYIAVEYESQFWMHWLDNFASNWGRKDFDIDFSYFCQALDKKKCWYHNCKYRACSNLSPYFNSLSFLSFSVSFLGLYACLSFIHIFIYLFSFILHTSIIYTSPPPSRKSLSPTRTPLWITEIFFCCYWYSFQSVLYDD